MLTLALLLSLAAPPSLEAVPVPKFAPERAVAAIPVPKFGGELEAAPAAKAKPILSAPVRNVGPYVDPPGYHRHRCATDGTIWSHKPGGSHDCPTCGRQQLYHYTGPDAPTVLPKLKSDASPLYSIPGLYRSRENCPTTG